MGDSGDAKGGRGHCYKVGHYGGGHCPLYTTPRFLPIASYLCTQETERQHRGQELAE